VTHSPDREQLKRLIDLVPEEDLLALQRLLLGLIALDRDPSVAALVVPPAAAPRPTPAAPLPLADPLAGHGADTELAKRRLLALLDDD
jgi:hypothetical protein